MDDRKIGKISNKGSQYIEAKEKSQSKKPQVEKGGDLRAKKTK